MIRKAFVMQVHTSAVAEYERRHNPIWAQLEKVLRDHGVRNYSIFLLEDTKQLFAYAEIESEERWAAIAEDEVCQSWWNYMSPLMAHNPDGSPVTHDLREVFNLS